MNLLEVYTPALEVYVRYKVMDSSDVVSFANDNQSLPRDEYVRLVLETIVFNLRSEVTERLRQLDKEEARTVLSTIYNGCIMLNPGLDVDAWLKISKSSEDKTSPAPRDDFPPMPPSPLDEESSSSTPAPQRSKTRRKSPKPQRITKAKFRGLESHLKANVIGQDEAVDSVVSALKRSITGLGDENRPLGVFLFAGASGVGKTQLAKELHSYLFGEEFEMVRIDCGEYQHKHENQKLIGSPPGYVAHDDGGHLTNQMHKNSHTVVLLDEVEKAHPDIWNTFLRVFDEGVLTDSAGKVASFKDAIIVMTTNLGNKEAVSSILDSGMGFGAKIDVNLREAEAPVRDVVEKHTNKAIRKHFRPEFLNRIDKTVVFNHLEGDTLGRIAELELGRLEDKLTKKGMTLTYDDSVIDHMVEEGVNPVEGARGLARVRRELIEDAVSDALLTSARWPRGTVIRLSHANDKYEVEMKRPARKKKAT